MKQRLPPSGGLPPSVRMGRRRARLWALFQRCNPKAKVPLFETHNSNDSGTPKASLSWTACEPYWEDLKETSVFLKAGSRKVIENNGDVITGVKVDFFTSIGVMSEGTESDLQSLALNDSRLYASLQSCILDALLL